MLLTGEPVNARTAGVGGSGGVGRGGGDVNLPRATAVQDRRPGPSNGMAGSKLQVSTETARLQGLIGHQRAQSMHLQQALKEEWNEQIEGIKRSRSESQQQMLLMSNHMRGAMTANQPHGGGLGPRHGSMGAVRINNAGFMHSPIQRRKRGRSHTKKLRHLDVAPMPPMAEQAVAGPALVAAAMGQRLDLPQTLSAGNNSTAQSALTLSQELAQHNVVLPEPVALKVDARHQFKTRVRTPDVLRDVDAAVASIGDESSSMSSMSTFDDHVMQNWMRGYMVEAANFDSVALFAEVRLQETMTRFAGAEHTRMRAVLCCDLLNKLGSLVGRYGSLFDRLSHQILRLVFQDYDAAVAAVTSGAADGPDGPNEGVTEAAGAGEGGGEGEGGYRIPDMKTLSKLPTYAEGFLEMTERAEEAEEELEMINEGVNMRELTEKLKSVSLAFDSKRLFIRDALFFVWKTHTRSQKQKRAALRTRQSRKWFEAWKLAHMIQQRHATALFGENINLLVRNPDVLNSILDTAVNNQHHFHVLRTGAHGGAGAGGDAGASRGHFHDGQGGGSFRGLSRGGHRDHSPQREDDVEGSPSSVSSSRPGTSGARGGTASSTGSGAGLDNATGVGVDGDRAGTAGSYGAGEDVQGAFAQLGVPMSDKETQTPTEWLNATGGTESSAASTKAARKGAAKLKLKRLVHGKTKSMMDVMSALGLKGKSKKGAQQLPVETAMQLVATIYEQKMTQIKKDDSEANFHQPLHEFAKEVLVMRYGIKTLAVKHLKGLALAASGEGAGNSRLEMFADIAGIPTDKFPKRAFDRRKSVFFFKAMRALIPNVKQVSATFSSKEIDRDHVVASMRNIYICSRVRKPELYRDLESAIVALPVLSEKVDRNTRSVRISIDDVLQVLMQHWEEEDTLATLSGLDLQTIFTLKRFIIKKQKALRARKESLASSGGADKGGDGGGEANGGASDSSIADAATNNEETKGGDDGHNSNNSSSTENNNDKHDDAERDDDSATMLDHGDSSDAESVLSSAPTTRPSTSATPDEHAATLETVAMPAPTQAADGVD